MSKDEDGYDGDSPSDLVCGFLDSGRQGLGLIEHLASYGWTITRVDAAKDAQIAAVEGERDRQYEYNVSQIAKQAGVEAQIAALREALTFYARGTDNSEAQRLPEDWDLKDYPDGSSYNRPIKFGTRARAALEMSGAVK